MASGGMVCAQIILSIFTIIEFLFGLALVVVGAVLKTSISSTLNVPGELNAPAIFLLVVGCILVVVSFSGCVGAWSMNRCLLVTFCVLTSIMFILVLAVAIVAFTVNAKRYDVLEELFKKDLEDKIFSFDEFQKHFNCCGLNRPEEWQKNPKYVSHPPKSCCKLEEQCNYNDDNIHKQGCKGPVGELMGKPAIIIGAVATACAAATFLTIIASAYVAHSIGNS